MRVHLFEFEDQAWFPDVIRKGGTDFLRYFLILSELYKPCIPLIRQALKDSGENNLIDLCSGGGGYVEQVYQELNGNNEQKIGITLSDKYPNLQAYELLNQRTGGGITYVSTPVDAAHVPPDLKGLRTLFSAVHHFKPDQVTAILKNAVDQRAPIALFDGGEKGILPMLGLLLFNSLAFLILTPFFKPFTFSRLFFTYLVPLIPLYTLWDGLVSLLRMYEPEELKKMADSLKADNYVWLSGKTRNRFGVRASYLIGYPKKNEN